MVSLASSPSAKPEIKNHRSDIDGLRAVAVLMVLVFHFDLAPAGTAGFIGVDVFFVISGFLITSIIIRQIEAEAFSLSNFYLNRIRRLAPALFATLLLAFFGGVVFLFPAELISLTKEIVVAQLYIANVYFWRTINYFGLSANSVFLLHTWSLGVEEQFYLFYPICLIFIHRYFKRHLWVLLFLAFLLSFALNLICVASKPEAVFYLLPSRGWELLIGAMVIPASRLEIAKKNGELIGLVGFALLVLSFFLFNKDMRFPGFFALMPTLGTGLIIASGSSSKGTFTFRILSNHQLGFIGVISYPLYLVHWPLTVFASILLDDYNLAWRISIFALSFVLAGMIYYFVERPIRGRAVLVSNGKIKIAYVGGIFSTIAIASFVWITQGVPGRFTSEVVRLASFSEDKPDSLSHCEYDRQSLIKNSDFCSIGDAAAAPRWLIYGDSHAWATHDIFDEWLKQKGQSGLFVFRHLCPPLLNVHLFHDNGQCAVFNKAVIEFLDQSPDIKNVVLVSIWRQAIEGILSDSEDRSPTKEESRIFFEKGFSETIQHLKSHGKNIYIWEPVPGAKRLVPQSLAREALSKETKNIRFSENEYFSANKFFFDVLAANRSLIKGSFSPSEILCSSGTCSVSIGTTTPLYFDDNHISRSSKDFWLRVLMRSD